MLSLPKWLVDFLIHVADRPLLMALSTTLGITVVHFIYQYVIRGFVLRRDLVRLADDVGRLKNQSPEEIKAALDAVFKNTPGEWGWIEYEETLHEQFEWQSGEKRTVAVRATVPAQSFLNSDTVIDPRLGSEYFKHLPGILTGIGIIGTFFGLIAGLQQFDPTAPEVSDLKKNLQGLFNEVKFAFTFSGFAIASAMIVTALEKWLYSSCVKWCGELVQELDGLFRAGVGEEYLSSLVQASHESASQTRQLKESLVEDLKVLLTNFSERQIESTRQMSDAFGQQIERSLQKPLENIAETVRLASGQQTQATGAVLEQLMTAFIAQMRDSIGGQMADMGALFSQTVASLTQVEQTMRSLVDDMRRAGGEHSASVSAAMESLLAKLAEHQQQQGKAVSAATQVAMDKLQLAVAKMADAQEAVAQRTVTSVTQTIDAMQHRVDGLVESNTVLTTATYQAEERLRASSMSAIDGMAAAAARMEATGQALNDAAERMAALSVKIVALEEHAVEASKGSREVAASLVTASQAVLGAMTRMAETATRVEAVSRVLASEADVRNSLLRDLQRMADQSRDVGAQLGNLTEQVKTTLQENVESFGMQVGQALEKHLNDYRQHLDNYQKLLGSAVDMLRNALQELAEYADREKT